MVIGMARYYTLTHEPKPKELREIAEKHFARYRDYCRVWYEDGTKGVYANNCYYVSNLDSPNQWIVSFYSAQLEKDGSFGRLGIIRAKRIVEEKKKGVDN